MRRFLFLLLPIVFFVNLQTASAMDNTDLVKGGIFNFNKTRTIGQAFDYWQGCDDKKWSSFTTESHIQVVQFECNLVIPSSIKTTDIFEYDDPQSWEVVSMSQTYQFTINLDDTFQLEKVTQKVVWDDGEIHEAPGDISELLPRIYDNWTIEEKDIVAMGFALDLVRGLLENQRNLVALTESLSSNIAEESNNQPSLAQANDELPTTTATARVQEPITLDGTIRYEGEGNEPNVILEFDNPVAVADQFYHMGEVTHSERHASEVHLRVNSTTLDQIDFIYRYPAGTRFQIRGEFMSANNIKWSGLPSDRNYFELEKATAIE